MKKTGTIQSQKHAQPRLGVPQRTGSNGRSGRRWLRLARLRAEKADLKESRVAYQIAYQKAHSTNDVYAELEALSGLLRLAAEALDDAEVARIERLIKKLENLSPENIPPELWYVRAVLAQHRGRLRASQKCLRLFIFSVDKVRGLDRKDQPPGARGVDWEYEWRKGTVGLVALLVHRSMHSRAAAMAKWVIDRLEMQKYPSLLGILELVLSHVAMVERRFLDAQEHLQRADQLFLSEHNWFYHIHTLSRRAKLCRAQGEWGQAQWYLDTLDQVCVGGEFARLRAEVSRERLLLERESLDLKVDARTATIDTRESKQIPLGKQFVLLHILEALTQAHEQKGGDFERGLSKAEIISAVWSEKYQPGEHDNRLYYNINRLRNLIEPDVKNPKYLLNSRTGYRLAPGLRIQFIGGAQKKKAPERAGDKSDENKQN